MTARPWWSGQVGCDCNDCDGTWCVWCLEHHGKRTCPFEAEVVAELQADGALVHGWEPARQGFTCGAPKRAATGRAEVDRRAHPSSVGSPAFDLQRDETFCPECVRRLTQHAPAGAPAPAGGSRG